MLPSVGAHAAAHAHQDGVCTHSHTRAHARYILRTRPADGLGECRAPEEARSRHLHSRVALCPCQPCARWLDHDADGLVSVSDFVCAVCPGQDATDLQTSKKQMSDHWQRAAVALESLGSAEAREADAEAVSAVRAQRGSLRRFLGRRGGVEESQVGDTDIYPLLGP